MSYRILADCHTMENDTWVTGLNNNDIIIGPSGSGKTRGYVKPNILQCNESMIITDTKGSLQKEVGGVLEQNGYRIIKLDMTDCFASCGYNPFDYIRYDERRECYIEQDIMTMAACMVPVEIKKDPFWEKTGRMVLESLISYVLECLPEEEYYLDSVIRLFREMSGKSFDYLFQELKEMNPDSFAVNRYDMYKLLAPSDRTTASVLGILAEKLSVMAFDGAKAMFHNPDKIQIKDLGREKTAVFLTISDTDRSMDRLANLFYTQALHTLCHSADKDYENNRLPVPVRFILDDFAANVCIPDFHKTISVIRSREIYVSIILQSISQLESLYGHADAMTILNNCDNCLYLGGQDVETAKYISIKANKPVSSILNMPLDSAWLFTRGSNPKEVRKYNLKNHERYRELPECKELEIG